MNPLIFVHIPKTAGTSLRVAAENYYGTKNCVFDYGVGENSSDIANQLNTSQITIEEFWHFVKRNKISFITGHFEAKKYITCSNGENIFSLLRDPISRIISEYNHLKKNNGYEEEFSTFYRTSEQINRQTQLLSGLAPEANLVLGVTELYVESLSLINIQFGTNFLPLVENRSEDLFVSKEILANEVIEELLELNALDMELYSIVLNDLKKSVFFLESNDETFESFCLYKNGTIQKSNCTQNLLRKENQSATEKLLPGWKIKSVVNIEDGISVAILKHRSFGHGVWYFDSSGNFIGNTASVLINSVPSLRDGVRLIFLRIIYECVTPDTQEPILINLLGQGLLSELSSVVDIVFEFENILSNPHYSIECNTLRSTPQSAQDSILKAPVPSIDINYSGYSLKATRGIVVNDYIIAYPLFNGNLIDSVLFTGGHDGVHLAILKFDDNKLCYINQNLIGSHVVKDLLLHINHCWLAIRNYFDQLSPSHIIGITRSSHIGHRIWNDATGLYRIQQQGLLNSLKSIVHYDHFGIGEIWISAKEIFKNYEIDFKLAGYNSQTVSDVVYKDGGFPLRIGDRFIPKGLIDLIDSTASSQIYNLMSDRIGNGLVVVFGLRLENRTWVNQLEGLAELACFLTDKNDSLTIIVDGHDRIGSNQIRSHGENNPMYDLVKKEKNVVNFIKKELETHGRSQFVNVIDAVDLELEKSIALIKQADFFVAPWGAGLAKYKWFANLSGIILTSNYVMKNKPDLYIYEDPTIREGATKCLYLDPVFIEDLFDSNSEIDLPDRESRGNFKVDIIGLKFVAEKMLGELNK